MHHGSRTPCQAKGQWLEVWRCHRSAIVTRGRRYAFHLMQAIFAGARGRDSVWEQCEREPVDETPTMKDPTDRGSRKGAEPRSQPHPRLAARMPALDDQGRP
jgi:hypothetical protein